MANHQEDYLASELLDKMLVLRNDVYQKGMTIYHEWESAFEREDFKSSAQNLSFYLALRQIDIRQIQSELSLWGLSSLGRLESRTLDTIDAVIYALGKITGREVSPIVVPSRESFVLGQQQLVNNSKLIFGKSPKNRSTKIMITLPLEAAENPAYVEGLMKRGMNVGRINCAHDTVDDWLNIITNIRKAEKSLGQTCKVLMDVAGPKARISWMFVGESINRVKVDDSFLLTGLIKVPTDHDKIILGCSLPSILEDVEVGHPVLVDDGVIEGEVTKIVDDGVLVKIKRVVDPKGIRLRVDKGLNFPKTQLKMDVITDKDRQDLDFVIEHADIAGFSFVKSVKDMDLIIKEVRKRTDNRNFPILAKIETIQGIQNLPDIILSTAGRCPLSVMIARGDLAVESGYLRLAELQQEILWICEAADIPTVWATQVLDNMVATGIPTRAEVTDVAEGGSRAECIMLNKGDHLLETVSFLDEVLIAMAGHQYKKTPRLRALNVAKGVSKKKK